MIKKHFIGLCLLAGISMISCGKSESKHAKNKADSSVVSQSPDHAANSLQKPDAQKPDSADSENKEKKDLESPVSKTIIEGKFVANTCDGGRFSMEFKNIDGKPTFKIFDKSKVIAAGNVSSESDEKTGEITAVAMGEIGGLYEGDKIVVQNSGNTMNEFEHFTQCGDKYLEFIKQK
ncbi:hypothetical protein QFZ37_003678 [Chryseobacterium ginsenosidimutans]|uniref:hypothetical protein n=1 Tax=Chryseobacterium ginsenosidimutans TaxID=687846 RepID=UPI00278B603A|nr:hypothetical protein [Chryseobacterium ginsenosidimutans]MDQ0595309.1 hypothetical protein [Chryseobacterium ginsenosidimutans]